MTRTGAPNASRPSGDVTLIVIGNVPDARASTVKRIVLLPGFSDHRLVGAVREHQLRALEVHADLHVARGFEVVLEASAAPRACREVSVMRFSSARMPSEKDCTA